MKRIKLIPVIVLIFAMMFSITSCGSKESISSDDFKSTMEKNEFTVSDATAQFSGYDYIKNVYVAVDKDANYQIEFYEISDNEYADKVFQNNRSIFEESKGSSSAEASSSGKNYETYSLSSNNTYKYISRINNTMLYIDVSSDYKDSAKNIIEKLNY